MGFALSGVWFGCNILLRMKVIKNENLFINSLVPVISSIIPTLLILRWKGESVLKLNSLKEIKLWSIVFFTLFITCCIKIFLEKKQEQDNRNKIVFQCIEAAGMEVPQRMMMQNFIYLLLRMWNLNTLACIVINALIWCAGIIIQAIIFQKISAKALWASVCSLAFVSITLLMEYRMVWNWVNKEDWSALLDVVPSIFPMLTGYVIIMLLANIIPIIAVKKQG